MRPSFVADLEHLLDYFPNLSNRWTTADMVGNDGIGLDTVARSVKGWDMMHDA
jgi:hypothetical protein